MPVFAAHRPPAIGPLPITSPELLEELDELELLLDELELLLEELELLDELELLLEDELELLLLLEVVPEEPLPPQPTSSRPRSKHARGLKKGPQGLYIGAVPRLVISKSL